MWLIFVRSLVKSTREPYFHLRRAGLALVIAFVLIAQVIIYDSNTATLGQRTFQSFISIAALLSCLLTPVISTHLLDRERRQGTFELLFLTRLSSWDIVGGKFFSFLCLSFLHYLAALPLAVILLSMGGVSAEQLFVVSVLILGLISFATGAGLFATAICEAPLSQAMASLIVLLWLALSTLFSYLGKEFISGNELKILSQHLSPIFSFYSVVIGKQVFYGLFCSLVHFVFTAILLFAAAYFIGQEAQPGTEKKAKRRKKRVPVSGNPISWRDYEKVYGGDRVSWLKGMGTLLLSFGLFQLYLHWAQGTTLPNKMNLATFSAFTFVMTVPFLMFTLFSTCVHSFVREKDQGNFDLLLTTDLSNRELVGGKVWAIFKSTKPFLLISLGSAGILWWISPKWSSLFAARNFVYVFFLSANALAICAWAFFLSSFVRSARQVSMYTFAFLLVWHSIEKLTMHGVFVSPNTLANFLLWINFFFGLANSLIIYFCFFFSIRKLRVWNR